MFNIYMGIFITIAIIVIAGGAYQLFSLGKSISAIIFLAGSIAIFSIFGIRWFNSAQAIFSGTPVPWPPVVNTCPDYLMYYKRKKSDGTTYDTCVDTIGIAKNGTLQIFPKDGNVNNDNDAYFFSLDTKSSDASKKSSELCQRCLQYGLTWEGITNGESCAVTSSGGSDSPSGGGSSGGGCDSNCPTSCTSS
jgi:uncharacterized membrane protein YgcG